MLYIVQVQKDVPYRFPARWQQNKGLYPSDIKLNMAGNWHLEMVRDATSVFDNNMFATTWISICLLEAHYYAKVTVAVAGGGGGGGGISSPPSPTSFAFLHASLPSPSTPFPPPLCLTQLRTHAHAGTHRRTRALTCFCFLFCLILHLLFLTSFWFFRLLFSCS